MPPQRPSHARRKKGERSWAPVLVALAGALLLAGVFLLPDLLPEESELVPVEPEAQEPEVPPLAPELFAEPELAEEGSEALPEPQEPLPPLEASDGWVRAEASDLSGREAYRDWLAGADDLIRRFVAAVDEIAAGQIPRAHLPFLRPAGAFRTRADEDGVVTSPRSFRRYDAFAEVVGSLDPERCAALYRRGRPLVEEAFADLGYPDVRFDERLRAALSLLLATPVPTGRERLVQPSVRWLYQDERLEGLEPAQKQLMRMGPENVRRVQQKLRELESALGPAS